MRFASAHRSRTSPDTFQGKLPEETVVIKKPKVRGGVLLKADAAFAETPKIEPVPAPAQVIIPLLHHDGTPAVPCVSPGDLVACGQCIGNAAHESAAPVHASVSGTITAIVPYPYVVRRDAMSVIIENNGKDEFASPIPYDKPVKECKADDLVNRIALSGIIDANGSAVPLYQKLAAAVRRPADLLIVNALITEPYANARSALIHERAEEIITGATICMTITGATRCRIAVSEKQPEIHKVFSSLINAREAGEITLAPMKPRYPFHHEQLLVRAFTGAELRGAGSSLDAGCLVIGCEALAALRDAVMELMPCYVSVVAVGGPAAGSPKTFRARIGTPVRTLLEACATDFTVLRKVVAGGPLSGSAIQDLNMPVLKTTSAIVALDSASLFTKSRPCMKCRRCQDACPVRLEPARLVSAVQAGDYAAANVCRITECLECGCCSYVCPSRINLVHWLQYGKVMVKRANGNTTHKVQAIA
jgi:electron transport complex protein RnfC